VAIKNPRTLVVDADIAQATGGKDAIHPIPVRCREFLREIYHLGHKVIFTDEILAEWKNHQSEFAADWFLEMTASGKIVRVKGQTRDDDLREAIFEAIHENARNVVAKDLHLVEAAKLAHEIVASKDNRTRNHLKIAAIHVEAIKTIIWVNPKPPEADNEKDEMCIIWLREGALYEEERSLAYKKP
jgi:hypothetical protein